MFRIYGGGRFGARGRQQIQCGWGRLAVKAVIDPAAQPPYSFAQHDRHAETTGLRTENSHGF
jgi:hypothetical protein